MEAHQVLRLFGGQVFGDGWAIPSLLFSSVQLHSQTFAGYAK